MCNKEFKIYPSKNYNSDKTKMSRLKKYDESITLRLISLSHILFYSYVLRITYCCFFYKFCPNGNSYTTHMNELFRVLKPAQYNTSTIIKQNKREEKLLFYFHISFIFITTFNRYGRKSQDLLNSPRNNKKKTLQNCLCFDQWKLAQIQ